MRVHQEAIPEIDRYLANYGSYELKDKTPEYQRYLNFVGRLRKIDASMRILEVGTGTGWFPLLCKANGLRCKGLEIMDLRPTPQRSLHTFCLPTGVTSMRSSRSTVIGVPYFTAEPAPTFTIEPTLHLDPSTEEAS